MNIYYYNFNNYYNRIIKFFGTLTEYASYQVGSADSGINFNPNDDIMTTLITNRTPTDIGDYLIVADDSGIVSRWYIIEKVRLRTGQYKLTLKHDLISDYYAPIVAAPAFIEKATLEETDPFIFNSEDMTFNQIKTDEIELKDETGCAWIVGYIPKTAFSSGTSTITADITMAGAEDFSYPTYSDFPLYDLINQDYIGRPYNVFYETRVKQTGEFQSYDWVATLDYINRDRETIRDVDTENDSGYYSTLQGSFINQIRNMYLTQNGGVNPFFTSGRDFSPYTNYSGNTAGNPSIEDILQYDGKIFKTVDTGNYYQIKIDKTTDHLERSFVPSASALGTSWASNLNMTNLSITGSPNDKTFRLRYNYDIYTVRVTQYVLTASSTIDSHRLHLIDQPYDMFCLPYSDTLYIQKNGTYEVVPNKNVSLRMAIEIAKQVASGSQTVYDLQLVPYCPVRQMIKVDGSFDVGNEADAYDYIFDSDSHKIGMIFWCSKSEGSFDIQHSIPVTEAKIENQCDMWRLVSPNYNGQFEFNAAKNGGVNLFNVDFSYKPFNPYIHINPNFGKLYGKDFNDARGLICGGDFSVTQLTDQWQQYQMQNVNYQKIFDRQIQNMEVSNKYQNIQATVGALAGAVGGAAMGAVLGGPVGALAGGAASLLGGVADVGIQKALQEEALDYKKDMFGYQLGNIQALPNSLSKVSSMNLNNKLFPILEYYTCTEEEKQALRDKLYYNGMTVMRIGTIQQFIRQNKTYIKAKIIRIEDLGEDTHLINEIANEINKGVFI